MLIAIGRPVSDHLGSCSLEGGVDFLHSITEVLAISNGISQAKDSNWLVFQVNPCKQDTSVKQKKTMQLEGSSLQNPTLHLTDL